MTRLTLYWLPAAVWAVFISVVSQIPAREIQKAADAVDDAAPFALDIAYHTVVFAVMGGLAYRVASLHLRRHARWSYLAALAFAIAYGVMDEFHQSFVSGRSSAAEDVGYDTLGAIVGIAGVSAIRFIISKRSAA